jgi:hypothetical protein
MAGARRLSRRAPSTYQPACKPGSVGRGIAQDARERAFARRARRPFLWDAGCPAPPATYPDGRTRTQVPGSLPRRPYSVLLPVGFAVPFPLPETRCALTAPFHPCRHPRGIRRSVLCGTFPGIRDACAPLLPPDVIRHRMSMEPGLSSQCCLSALHQAAVRPTDGTDVGCFRNEINEAGAKPLTSASRSRWSTGRPAHRRGRDGNGAGMR